MAAFPGRTLALALALVAPACVVKTNRGGTCHWVRDPGATVPPDK